MMEEENACLPQSLERTRGCSFLDKEHNSTLRFKDWSPMGSQARSSQRRQMLTGVQKIMNLTLISVQIRRTSIVRIKSLILIESAFKCFDNYLGFVQQTYYGLPITSAVGKNKSDIVSTSTPMLHQKKPVLNQTNNF